MVFESPQSYVPKIDSDFRKGNVSFLRVILPHRLRFARPTLPLVGRVGEATEQGEVAETGRGWRRLALSLADASTFRHPHPALRPTLPTRGRVKPAANLAPILSPHEVFTKWGSNHDEISLRGGRPWGVFLATMALARMTSFLATAMIAQRWDLLLPRKRL
jgi:hypothetical protein